MEENLDGSSLIARFLENNLDEEELIVLKRWMNESYENRKLFDQYNEVWQLSHVVFNEGLYNTEAGWSSLQKSITKNSIYADNRFRLVGTNQLIIWKAASVAAMLVAALFIGLFIRKNDRLTNNQTVTIQSPRGEKSKIILADSTVVWLNSESQLTYSNDFDGEMRLVTLSGEGYFDVKEDRDRPFIVKTTNADIEVYGTRFNVSSYPDEQQTETTLEAGKIGVYIVGKSNPVTVNPGQRFILNKQTGETSLKQVDTDLYTSWKENKLRFDNALFGDVVKKLERWYDVKIFLDKDLVHSERYTMCIKTESLREVMKRIKLTTPMSYKIDEEKVFIYPKNRVPMD